MNCDFNIVETIKEYAEENNCLVGVSSAEPPPGLMGRLAQAETPFVTKSLERRVSPASHLRGVKSVVALGVPYGPVCAEIKPILATAGEKAVGEISCMALSRDYHQTVKLLLNGLASRIGAREFKIFVDSGGGLSERAWAVKSGLGFWGRNCCVVSPSRGSFFNIGLLLTRMEPPPDSEAGNGCGQCSRCADACPGKAISPQGVDYKKCVSYITQKNGELSTAEISIMGRRVYGCDVCQRVCPYNQNKLPDCPEVSLAALMHMTGEGFAQTCGLTAMSWKGPRVLKRNANAVYNAMYKWG